MGFNEQSKAVSRQASRHGKKQPSRVYNANKARHGLAPPEASAPLAGPERPGLLWGTKQNMPGPKAKTLSYYTGPHLEQGIKNVMSMTPGPGLQKAMSTFSKAGNAALNKDPFGFAVGTMLGLAYGLEAVTGPVGKTARGYVEASSSTLAHMGFDKAAQEAIAEVAQTVSDAMFGLALDAAERIGSKDDDNEER